MSFEAQLRPVWNLAKAGTDQLPINSTSIQGCFPIFIISLGFEGDVAFYCSDLLL
jgi:hypothetical protein